MAYEIKPMGVGGILDQSIQLLKNRFALLVGICLIISGPFLITIELLTIAIEPNIAPDAGMEERIAAQQEISTNAFILLGVSAVGLIFAFPITTAAVTHAVAGEYLGEEVSIGSSIGNAFRVIVPLILTSILMFVIVYLGLLACILPGILFLFRYFLTSQIVILEKLSGTAALRRSKELMLHDRTKNYNTAFLVSLVVGVINFGIGVVTEVIPSPYISMIVSAIAQSISSALGAAAITIFYFSCRCKYENFDLVHLSGTLKSTDQQTDEWEGDFQKDHGF